MMLVLVVYDIGGNRRREEISAVLEACGARVQLSVFECELPSVGALNELVRHVDDLVDPDDDQVRFYVLGDQPRIVGNRRLQERQLFWIL